MDNMQMDEVTEQLIYEVLNTEHNRLIAAILGQVEAHLGRKDPRISRIVKDSANASKRIMATLITKTEVEPRSYGSPGTNSTAT
jgi:hypothetical protein